MLPIMGMEFKAARHGTLFRAASTPTVQAALAAALRELKEIDSIGPLPCRPRLGPRYRMEKV